MNFNSLDFLLFFPLVLALYWRIAHKNRWVLLLAASYYFYMRWNPWLVFLILGTTLISFVAARRIAAETSPKRKRLWLTLTLLVCLGTLFVFKYLNFFMQSAFSVARLFGADANDISLQLLLPVGISFYTFQTLSYVIDVYRGNIAPEPHFGSYALFVSFFPQLVAGPIERPENLLPQLKQPHLYQRQDMADGLRWMLCGFYKKIVVADCVAPLVEQVYNAPAQATGAAIVAATVLFAVQVYCDFSGYSDIATGAARMMGVRLMVNFDRPYSARSVREFWRRWHISLSSWLSDYVYIPLGGSRKGLGRQCFNLMVVFLLSGLWHGASWTFFVWGALHGLYLVAETLCKGKRSLPHWLRHTLTLALVCFAWIFFRANDLPSAFLLVQRLFTAWQGASLAPLVLPLATALQILLSLCALPLLPRLTAAQPPAQTSAQAAARAYTYGIFIYAIALAWLGVLSSGGESAFLYFQF